MLIAITLLLLAIGIVGWNLADNTRYGSGAEFLCIVSMVIGFLGAFFCAVGTLAAPISEKEFPVSYKAEPTSKEIIVYAKEKDGKEYTFRSEKKVDFESYVKNLPAVVVKHYNSWNFEVGNSEFKVKE